MRLYGPKPFFQYLKKKNLFFPSGTKEEEVDSSEAGKSCLDEKTALRLASLGIQLEKKFGSARDIEFAIKQVILIYTIQVAIIIRESHKRSANTKITNQKGALVCIYLS